MPYARLFGRNMHPDVEGRIYLWSANVTTGDQSPASADLSTAESALNG
jgi:hypothetical protein